jgi:ketosteroid isomerase-like protein
MPEPSPVAVIRTLVDDHFRHTIAKQVEAIIDRYAPSPDTYVFVEGPRWSTTGIDRIATGWRAYVGAPMAMLAFEWIEGPHAAVGEALAWHAGIVDIDMQIRDSVRRVRFRATHVLRRADDGQWLIEHEHFSRPAADPYGIGDWLPSAATA